MITEFIHKTISTSPVKVDYGGEEIELIVSRTSDTDGVNIILVDLGDQQLRFSSSELGNGYESVAQSVISNLQEILNSQISLYLE